MNLGLVVGQWRVRQLGLRMSREPGDQTRRRAGAHKLAESATRTTRRCAASSWANCRFRDSVASRSCERSLSARLRWPRPELEPASRSPRASRRWLFCSPRLLEVGVKEDANSRDHKQTEGDDEGTQGRPRSRTSMRRLVSSASMSPPCMAPDGLRARRGGESEVLVEHGAGLLRPAVSPQDLLHRLALGEFVDQLVELADLLHQRVLDRLDAHAADDALDQRRVRVSAGASAKKVSKSVSAAMCFCRPAAS